MSQFMNLDGQTIVAKDRMSDLLAEAERTRLVRQARANRPNRFDAVLAGVGDLLITAGERLQARRLPVAPQPCDMCCADYSAVAR
jgi:hypothetical protein